MIFLTLGTQLPFDRLVREVDAVAGRIDEPIFGQIGRSQFAPVNFPFVAELSPHEFQQRIRAARVIIGHAGVGTILAARRENKPLLMMARLSANAEHRNDHQVATARRLGGLPGMYVVESQHDIEHYLHSNISPPGRSDTAALSRFIDNLRLTLTSATN